jgi:hypothetical protein
MNANNRVLLIAYHFPPLAGSSGIQRTLRFAQHLPSFGWEPLVLTAKPWAYERTSDDLNADVPSSTVVRRAFAMDAARHLSVKGHYVAAMARPDRWVSWRFDAVRQGMRLIREFRPQVIWSTYPIATAHMIGAELQQRSGLPWVADFRDPMAQEGYPDDPKTWRAYKAIETHALNRAALSVFTTPSAAAEYQQRYPEVGSRIRMLENGYDEETFANAASLPDEGALTPGAVTLLHSGIVYPIERDPTQLMAALRELHDQGSILPGRLRIRFRAAMADELLLRLAAENGVADYVEVLPPIPYGAALTEMLRADGLLLLQASNCNAQIPAKVYEYLRSGRPILCLSDPAGDTAHVLRTAGLNAIARLDSALEIARILARFIDGAKDLKALPLANVVERASRRGRAETLAEWLTEVSTAQ